MVAQTMFAPLSIDEQEVAAEVKPAASPTMTPIMPVPGDAPRCAFRHPKFGAPAWQWDWQDANGKLIAHTMRFDFEKNGKPEKEVLPITYCEIKVGDRTTHAWRACGVRAQRPLYRLPRLLSLPAKPVLFTEGERKADTAAELFADFETTTTMGGASQPHLSDFSVLTGRDVLVWPDHDDAGSKYAHKVGQLALKAGAKRAAVVSVPETFPPKWDLADELPAGATVDNLRRMLAQAVEIDAAVEGAPEVELPSGYFMTDRGLIWRDRSDDDKPEILLAGKFEVIAETRDGDGTSWGVLLQWKDHDGHQHEYALPRAALAGDGVDARKVLLDGGLYVAPGRKPRDLLTAYLASVRSPNRARATHCVGWHGGAFDGVGPTDQRRRCHRYQGRSRHHPNAHGQLPDLLSSPTLLGSGAAVGTQRGIRPTRTGRGVQKSVRSTP